MTTKLPDDLLALISESFIKRLLTMQYRSHDRDYSEAWLADENFGDFYAAFSRFFLVGFSKPEMLVSAIVKMYVKRQVGVLLNRLEASDGKGGERLDVLLDQAIEAHYPALSSALEATWPAQYADIARRNSAGQLPF